MTPLLVVLLTLAALGPAAAAVRTMPLEYGDGGNTFDGYLAYDDSTDVRRPGVLVVHEWWGLTEHPKRSARRLAEQGYIALAVDMYGKGRVTDSAQQAGQWAGEVRGNPAALLSRFAAAMEALKARPLTDPARIGAIGYCFGGTVVLEVARQGAALAGVVSFHGGLASSVPEEKRNLRARVLVCHGADDPAVAWEQVTAFREEMQRAKADWQLDVYGGAVHAFTNPDANSPTARYNERAARRSWEAMTRFLRECLGPAPNG